MTDDKVYDLPPTISKLAECDDAISRETVMQALIKLGYGDEENGADAEYMSALWDVAKEIESLPPVTPKPKTGKWVYDGGRFGSTGRWLHIYKCSECGRTVYIDSERYDKLTETYPYCHCGAKMEGVSE